MTYKDILPTRDYESYEVLQPAEPRDHGLDRGLNPVRQTLARQACVLESHTLIT